MRLRGLLGTAGGWVPEPLPEQQSAASAAASVPQAAPRPLDALGSVAGVAQAPEPVPAAAREPGPRALLPARLTSGRLDLTQGAVAGLLAVGLLAALLTSGVVLRNRPRPVPVPRVLASGVPLPGLPSPSPPPAGEVVVAVAGTVRHPGLVRLPAGSRVDDAVRAAGGLLPGSSAGLLNLARKLVDGEQVLVGIDPPPGVQGVGGAGGGGGGAVAGGALDLNAASASDLDALPGIGPVLAQRIVDWRTAHGRFESVDQLREVTGIGEAKFTDLRDAVAVR